MNLIDSEYISVSPDSRTSRTREYILSFSEDRRTSHIQSISLSVRIDEPYRQRVNVYTSGSTNLIHQRVHLLYVKIDKPHTYKSPSLSVRIDNPHTYESPYLSVRIDEPHTYESTSLYVRFNDP